MNTQSPPQEPNMCKTFHDMWLFLMGVKFKVENFCDCEKGKCKELEKIKSQPSYHYEKDNDQRK
jgi:hypothetical protein